MSPVVIGFGALDAMIAAQAAYAARDLTRKRKRKKVARFTRLTARLHVSSATAPGRARQDSNL